MCEIVLAGRVKRLKGQPDEAAVMRAHLSLIPLGLIFLGLITVTGLWMFLTVDYQPHGWIHAKLGNLVLMLAVGFGMRIPSVKKTTAALAQGAMEEARLSYRRVVMSSHVIALFIWMNVILGFWKPM